MSADATLNGADILEGRLIFPLSGIWHGELWLSGDAPAQGPTELVVVGDGEPDVRFACAVASVASVEGRSYAFIVGGSGGLSQSSLGVPLDALHYDGDPEPVTAAELLSDICELAREQLDPASKAALGAFTAPSWLREAGLAFYAMARVLRRWSLSARMLPSGALWAGQETWPAIDREPEKVDPIDDGYVLYTAPRGASCAPGLTILEKRILRAEYVLGAGLRALLWYREGLAP